MLIAITAIQAALFAYLGYKDYRYGIIPNKAVLAGLLTALVAAFLPDGIGFMSAWQGFLITAVVGIVLWKIGKLPAGDAKLFMLVGLTLGFPMFIAGVLGGLMIGAAVLIPFVIVVAIQRHSLLAGFSFFRKGTAAGPFIALATITVLAWRVFIILVAG